MTGDSPDDDGAIRLPRRVPLGFHGNWLPDED